eukprot:6467481-Amphidinium_carterae.3
MEIGGGLYLKDVCAEGKHVQERYIAELVPKHGAWTAVANAKRSSQCSRSLGMYKWAPTGENNQTVHLAPREFPQSLKPNESRKEVLESA